MTTTALVKVAGTTYVRRAYTDPYGHRHKAIEVTRGSHKRKARRSKKRRAKCKKWFSPKVKMDWGKSMALRKRRGNALKAHKGDLLATGRALVALANVTEDSATELEARKDAKHFLELYKGKQRR